MRSNTGWGGGGVRGVYPSCGVFGGNTQWGGGGGVGGYPSPLIPPRLVRGPHRRLNVFGSYHKMIYLFHTLNLAIVPKSIKFIK